MSPFKKNSTVGVCQPFASFENYARNDILFVFIIPSKVYTNSTYASPILKNFKNHLQKKWVIASQVRKSDVTQENILIQALPRHKRTLKEGFQYWNNSPLFFRGKDELLLVYSQTCLFLEQGVSVVYQLEEVPLKSSFNSFRLY